MKRLLTITSFTFLLFLLLAAPLVADDKPDSQAANARATVPPSWYRVEFALNEFVNGKKINTRTYSVDAEEGSHPGILHIGNRVPIVTGSFTNTENKVLNTNFQYIDVGVNIRCEISDRSGAKALTADIDISSLTDAKQFKDAVNQPIIRQVRSNTTTIITFGKSMVIANMDDPSIENRRFQIEATVTILNP